MSDVETALRRELQGVQEMLFLVLSEVGQEVVVTKETMRKARPGDQMVNIEDTGEAFVFSIAEVTSAD